MEEELNLENILSGEEANDLFGEEDNIEQPLENSPQEEEKEKQENQEQETTEVQTGDLFTEEPESVGSGKEKNSEEQENTNSNEETSTSPKSTNFYSSITRALKEDGILPDLADDTVNGVKTPEDFANIIKDQISAGLDAAQQRIDRALNADVEPDDIKKYTRVLSYLDSITDEAISDESSKGENLRRQLIYQDYKNMGYSDERAKRATDKSFSLGADIEDAKEALAGNKEFFNSEYDNLVEEAEEKNKKIESKRKEEAEKLKKSILEDDKVFGDLKIDKSTRSRIYDNINKPIYRDPDTGEYHTALSKYQKEHPTEFLKNVGLIYTLTKGFSNLDGLIKTKVNKEVKKGLRDLENVINNTSRTSDGNLNFMSNIGDDSESYIGKGITLDV